MLCRKIPFPLIACFAALLPCSALVATPANLASDATATASSQYDNRYPPAFAIDGEISDVSRWLSADDAAPKWLRLDLPAMRSASGYILYSGYQTQDAIEQVYAEQYVNGAWELIPGSAATGNVSQELIVHFDAPVDVDALRFVFEQAGIVRVREIIVWSPDDPAPAGALTPPTSGDTPFIFVNQSGYNLGQPKRFNVQTIAADSAFTIQTTDGLPVYSGTLDGLVGDFNDFNPRSEDEFRIHIGAVYSDAFRIGPWWLERVTYQNAMDFMIDSRNRVGNATTPSPASFGWRDDHHFAFELSSLVAQYLSNPAAYERMTGRIVYETPRDNAWGALTPYPASAPDIVKLIHWGADSIITQGCTHEMLKSELASFLYAWPWLAPWLDQENYDTVLAFTLEHWADDTANASYVYDQTASDGHNLYAVKTKVGTTKGAYPPGFSIAPNTLMAVVMEREGDATAAAAFRQAARDQVAWTVDNLDLDDPLTTKGQRMNENLLLIGLATFARLDPAGKPSGFDAFIDEWASIAIARADNAWDFRRLSDTDWVPYNPDVPTAWNEPGNVAGLPAAALEAAALTTDPAQATRLKEISWAAFDNMFGRNPVARHFSYDAPTEIEGVERGWFSFYDGGVGQLKDVPFVLDGAPKDPHYPNGVEQGDIGWTEGWVNFNTAYNRSLAVLANHDTAIEIQQRGDRFLVTLTAPLNFDYAATASVDVMVSTSNGDTETVTLTAASQFSQQLAGAIAASNSTGTPTPSNGTLELTAGDVVRTSYGYGFYEHSAQTTATDIAPRDADSDGLDDEWERTYFGDLSVVSAETPAPGATLAPLLALSTGQTPQAQGNPLQMGSLVTDNLGEWLELNWSESIAFPENGLTQLYQSDDLLSWEAVSFDEIQSKLAVIGESADGKVQYLKAQVRMDDSQIRFFRIVARPVDW